MHVPPAVQMQTPYIQQMMPGGTATHSMQQRVLQPMSPPTPVGIKEIKHQLRRARNAQSLETSADVMRQRQLYIMDLESQLELEQSRRYKQQRQAHMQPRADRSGWY
eukprot:87489-Pleurochrysis_carterae.AAC.1